MILKIWFSGDLEEKLSDIRFPNDYSPLEDIEIETPCLPNIGDEIDWLAFADTERLSPELIDVLEDLSYNSMVVRKYWSKNTKNGGNVFCSLYVDIIK